MAPVSLEAIIKEFDLEIITSFNNLKDILITVADVTRPGLQLAGYFDHFGSDRIQVLGNMETAFLERLAADDRFTAVSKRADVQEQRSALGR